MDSLLWYTLDTNTPFSQVRVAVNIAVDSGHRAIKFNKLTGLNEKIFKEGWHLMLPWFERPYIFDVRTHPTTIKSVTGSKGKPLS